MEEMHLYVGLKLVSSNDCGWRIFSIENFLCRLIQTDISNRNIIMKSVHDVMDDISKGAFRIAENQETHVIDQENYNVGPLLTGPVRAAA